MKPKLGLVLGAGAARGWAHIGAVRALEEAGIKPDIICGCSIGAFVGSAAAAGELAKLENWVTALAWRDVVGLLDLGFNGGILKGEKLIAFFEKHFVDRDFGTLAVPFGCVATDLASGREVWLREGSVAAAVRASIALPGLFAPVVRDGRLLVDGGLVDPVPVSLCRAMGAEVVIAIDLGSNLAGKNVGLPPAEPGWIDWLRASLGRSGGNDSRLPSMATVLAASVNIMQTRIARSRLAGEPAEVLISPRLGHMGLMDYHRAEEAIAEGRAAVTRMLPAVEHALQSP